MSDTSYKLLHNSIDHPDVAVAIKEPGSTSSTSTGNEDVLSNRYVQIAVAVGLYWGAITPHYYIPSTAYYCRFVSITMVFLNKYLLSSNDVKVRRFVFTRDDRACVHVSSTRPCSSPGTSAS
jgi:hypothetical protein